MYYSNYCGKQGIGSNNILPHYTCCGIECVQRHGRLYQLVLRRIAFRPALQCRHGGQDSVTILQGGQ
jgi:hypothetical protein